MQVNRPNLRWKTFCASSADYVATNADAGEVADQRFHRSGKGQKVANYFAARRTPPEMKLRSPCTTRTELYKSGFSFFGRPNTPEAID